MIMSGGFNGWCIIMEHLYFLFIIAYIPNDGTVLDHAYEECNVYHKYAII